MILEHQPTIFPKTKFSGGLSSADNGNFRYGLEETNAQVKTNRQTFIQECGGTWEHTANLYFVAEGNNFNRYREATEAEMGVSLEREYQTDPVDGLYLRKRGRGLFLIVGDCAPVVLVNTKTEQAALNHVGRHSAEQDGAFEMMQVLQEELDWRQEDVLVWVGPAVGNDTYPLHKFAGKSLHQVITEQLHRAGLRDHQIEVCDIDTAQHDDYYSHSEHRAGRAERNGRFGVYIGLHPAPTSV